MSVTVSKRVDAYQCDICLKLTDEIVLRLYRNQGYDDIDCIMVHNSCLQEKIRKALEMAK